MYSLCKASFARSPIKKAPSGALSICGEGGITNCDPQVGGVKLYKASTSCFAFFMCSLCKASFARSPIKKSPCGGFVYLRRGRDSNPRYRFKPVQRFSKPALSATQAPLHRGIAKIKINDFNSQIGTWQFFELIPTPRYTIDNH
jgi:hypothetical protein